MSERPRRRLIPFLIVGIVLVAVAVGAALWWTDKQHYEATDNAFVAADKVTVAPQVDGYVTEVLVSDNQAVRAGDVLVRIDPSSIRARLAQAQANVAALEAGVRQVDDKAKLEQALIAQREAGVVSARAQAKWTAGELARYGQLSQAGYASTQREQTAHAAQDQASAAVDQALAALAAERQAAASLGSAREQTAAQAAAARAAVDQAQIDLSRTELRSPAAGVVGARGVFARAAPCCRSCRWLRPMLSPISRRPRSHACASANRWRSAPTPLATRPSWAVSTVSPRPQAPSSP